MHDEPSTDREVEIIMSHDSEDGKKGYGNFDEQVAQVSTRNSVSSELTIQMQQYLRVNNLERKQDPLEWWKRNCHLYPHVSKLAKNILLFQEHLFHHNEFLARLDRSLQKGGTG